MAVYDPVAGFVTGGGWIDSPAGAYTPDPGLTGKANFGFVAKYKKGQSEPTGQTELQFQVAGLNFHSTSYELLVVAGAWTQSKGERTINGLGSFGFMMTTIDGQQTAGRGSDKFRIKIWVPSIGDAETPGVLVNDNQPDDDDDAPVTTELQGGSIKIHTG